MHIENGFIKISGATDLEDSSMAGGMARLFNYMKTPDPLYMTYISENGMYQRCNNSKYLFSRDQFICLISGLFAEGSKEFVSDKRVDGRDLMSPSVNGHEARCAGQKPSWIQRQWFWLDVFYHATFTPTDEPNQLLCMMYVAYLCGDSAYLCWWIENNKSWEKSIENYWKYSFRNEPEFSDYLINFVKTTIKKGVQNVS